MLLGNNVCMVNMVMMLEVVVNMIMMVMMVTMVVMVEVERTRTCPCPGNTCCPPAACGRGRTPSCTGSCASPGPRGCTPDPTNQPTNKQVRSGQEGGNTLLLLLTWAYCEKNGT